MRQEEANSSFTKKPSHSRNAEMKPLRVSPIFKTKKRSFKMTGALEILELFTLHLLVYSGFSMQVLK